MTKMKNDKSYIKELLRTISDENIRMLIAHELYTYASRAWWYKKFYMIGQILILVFPVIVIVLEFGNKAWCRVVTACLMGAVTAIQALIRSLKVREKWEHYRKYCELMKMEVNFCNQGIGDYANVRDKEKKLAESIASLLEIELADWSNIKMKIEVGKKDS